MGNSGTRKGVKGLVIRGPQALILLKPNGVPDLPGGRVEPGENPFEALKRELLEEAGQVEVRIAGPLGTWFFLNKSGLLINGTTWLCCYVTGNVSLSSEHSGFTWKPVNQLKDLDIYHKYGLDKFSLNSQSHSVERGKTYDF